MEGRQKRKTTTSNRVVTVSKMGQPPLRSGQSQKAPTPRAYNIKPCLLGCKMSHTNCTAPPCDQHDKPAPTL
jgi:hypothetical protein